MYAYLSKFLCLLMISLLLLLLCVDAFHFVTTTTTTTTTRIRQQLQRGTSIHGVCVFVVSCCTVFFLFVVCGGSCGRLPTINYMVTWDVRGRQWWLVG